MSVVLAALDASSAARPVLETALAVSDLMAATVEAIHVREEQRETPQALASRNDVTLRVVEAPVGRVLVEAASVPEVTTIVVGARAIPGGRRPVGRTALYLVERVSKPLVVVPPDAAGPWRRPLRRLLVPLEGTEQSSRPVIERLLPLLAGEVALIVLHVFTAATVPPVLDDPERDLPLWGATFLARNCPDAGRIEWRTGSVGGGVADLCDEEAPDLVVLSWSQDISVGHGAVIRETLARSTVPVLLLPWPIRQSRALSGPVRCPF